MLATDLFGLDAASAALYQKFLDASREAVPVRTGALRDSLNIRTTKAGDVVAMELWGAAYGRYVITGTAPHDIFPVVKQALFWPGAAHPYAHVSHPGTRPNDFRQAIVSTMAPFMEAAGQDAAQIAIQNIRRRLAHAA